MCGLAGIYSPFAPPDRGALTRMADALIHRGPDDSGFWSEGALALAHRRLSIVDLSRAGAQPMQGATGRYVIAYNGEIYNAADLRSHLPSLSWRGHSDTEVLLAAIEHLGLEETLGLCDGMFAFALFDRREQTLHLVRDRLGEKPLWYGWAGRAFVFSSELYSLRAGFGAALTPDRNALAGYLRHNYLPAETSAFEGISRVPPGAVVSLTRAAAERRGDPALRRWWSLESAIATTGVPESPEEIDAQLLDLLRRSIRGRLVADVPVGAFLSGGIDSSLVTALMQEMSPQPVRTFTMGFEEAAWDEAPHAEAVAAHLGTEHTTLRIKGSELVDCIERVPSLITEPFADSSFIPSWMLSRLCRQHVTVALSGDGGDELFWGYRRYRLWEQACRLRRLVPASLRGSLADALSSAPMQALTNRLTQPDGSHQSGGARRSLGHRLSRIADLLREPDDRSLYRQLISHQQTPELLIEGAIEPATVYSDPAHWVHSAPAWRSVALADTLAYLPNDILTKVDRASMAVSLETRIPLLDHRLAAFACALPRHQVIDALGGKRPLRRILAGFVPESLTRRPKQGFGVPLDAWLRGPLRLWIGDVLSESTLRGQGLLHVDTVLAMRDAHLDGDADVGVQLWDFAMLTAWFSLS